VIPWKERHYDSLKKEIIFSPGMTEAVIRWKGGGCDPLE
jgi:hypothetical protein